EPPLPRESYREPADSLHLPRPTVTNNAHDVHQKYDEPKTEAEIASPLKSLTNSKGKLYFGSSFNNNSSNGVSEKPQNQQTRLLKNLMNFTPRLVRSPTLGELTRGDIITSSNRSFGVPNPRDTAASTRHKPDLAAQFHNSKNEPREKSLSEQNLSPSRRSTANFSQMVPSDANVEVPLKTGRGIGAGKCATPIPQRSTRIFSSRGPISLMQTSVNKDKNIVRTSELLNRLENNGSVRNVLKCKEENGTAVDNTYDLDVAENGDSFSSENTIENEAPVVTAYPDHPERDSLD
ncbi:hypothetical protein OTU49_007845, partial [Cherax quadricarinatus]